MKSVLVAAAAVLSIAAANPAAAALAPGDTAPVFSASAAQGDTTTTIDLAALLKKGPVVLYFFPSAFTESGETEEFVRNIEAFHAAGASIVGASRDTIDTLARFSAKEGAGKIPMASADIRTIDAFDVNDGAQFNTRTTYVIAPSGKIAFVHEGEDNSGHVKSALAFVQGMKR
jgi:peroxiredoxin